MSTRKYYKPAKQGAKFVLNRKEGRANIAIGSEGYSTIDPAIQSELARHPLKGHKAGFIEITSSQRRSASDTSTGDGNQADAGTADTEKKDTKSDNKFKNLPPDTDFPYNYGGSYYFLSNGQKVQGQEEAEAAQASLDTSSGEEKSDKGPAAEEVTNINQARDYLISEGLDGRKLTSKEKIIAAAKDLDPPVEFPNLD